MQKQINYLIVGVLVLLLVILGVSYNNRVPAEIPTQVETEDTTPAPESTPLTEEEQKQNEVNQANAEELKAQEAAKGAQWNTAMTNASMALNNREYDKAIAFYNEALSFYNIDTVYMGLFTVYGAQNNIDQARTAIDAAIKLNPSFTGYWNSKLTLLDEKTDVSFADLKKIYEEGLQKVDSRTKVDLVTLFAGIAENNWQYKDAIALWEYAKTLYPQNSLIYQGEIDRLKSL